MSAAIQDGAVARRGISLTRVLLLTHRWAGLILGLVLVVIGVTGSILSFQREIDAVNKKLARVQTVKRFAVLPRELTIEGGELTPTMKVRRKVVHEKYAAFIERLYR